MQRRDDICRGCQHLMKDRLGDTANYFCATSFWMYKAEVEGYKSGEVPPSCPRMLEQLVLGQNNETAQS